MICFQRLLWNKRENPIGGIAMAILNLDYYTQVDHYSDGDIEDQM